MPADFHWDTLNLEDPATLAELYTLLSENYVEDDDAMFRFDYPQTFLKWYSRSFKLPIFFQKKNLNYSKNEFHCRALQPPGWSKEWHCAVRVTRSGRLVGFISAIPATLKIYDKLVFNENLLLS